MRLADMFASTSQVSAWRPLLGGIGACMPLMHTTNLYLTHLHLAGTGRIRVSILFKPVDIYLPPSLRGWDVGTVLVERVTARGVTPGFQGAVSICIAGAKYRVRTEDSIAEDGSETGQWASRKVNLASRCTHTDAVPALACHAVTWTCDPSLRIPLLNRYQRALSVRLLDTHSSLGRTRTVGEGIVWPSHLVDDSDTSVRVDLYVAHKEKRCVPVLLMGDQIALQVCHC